MREDFDYVTMENYENDMAEARRLATAGMAKLRDDIEDHKRALAWVLRAAGGSISVPSHIMASLSDFMLVVEEDRSSNSRIFRAVKPNEVERAS